MVEESDKLRITKYERELIASTPPHECWVCDRIVNNIYKDEKGYYIKKSWLRNMGWKEHLEQILHKVI